VNASARRYFLCISFFSQPAICPVPLHVFEGLALERYFDLTFVFTAPGTDFGLKRLPSRFLGGFVDFRRHIIKKI
jgi:hypothetical protein